MGIGATSLRRLIREGRLPVLKVIKKVLILESDIEQFLRCARVTMRAQGPRPDRLPALPRRIAQSEHLR